jgi:hypothetical protein
MQQYPAHIPYVFKLQQYPAHIPYVFKLQQYPDHIPYVFRMQQYEAHIGMNLLYNRILPVFSNNIFHIFFAPLLLRVLPASLSFIFHSNVSLSDEPST